METTTVTVTVGRETRTVEARAFSTLDAAHSIFVDGVVASIGAGTARYPDMLRLARLQSGQATPQGATRVVDAEGREWSYHLATCIRNRQARIVGWADVLPVTNSHDQTRSAK